MSEVIYVDNDPRYIARECVKIPLTFQNCGDIECGAIVGIKSDGYGERVRRAALTADAAASATQLVLDSIPVNKGDSVYIMKVDGSALENLGAVTDINTATKTVTVTTGLTAAHATGSFLFVKDGSEKAVGVLAEPISDDGSEIQANVYIEGIFDTDIVTGVDILSLKDLNARVVNNILIV